MNTETQTEAHADEQLFEALESASEEAMTFAEAHGYLCAQAIQTQTIEASATLEEMLGPDLNTLTAGAARALEQSCTNLHLALRQHLLLGESPDLPCDPESEADPEHPPLMAWSIGFMQAVFESPEAWQGSDPELMSELTLPILAVSNLLDEAEFIEMAEDQQLMQSFCEQIPELIIDLFLLLNAPEER